MVIYNKYIIMSNRLHICNDVLTNILTFLDYKSLFNVKITSRQFTTAYLNCIKTNDDFLTNSVLKSNFCKIIERPVSKITKGVVKYPFYYYSNGNLNQSIHILGGISVQKYNDDYYTMFKTKTLYLKTPWLKYERIINFIIEDIKGVNYSYNNDMIALNSILKNDIIDKPPLHTLQVDIKKNKPTLSLNINEMKNWKMYFGMYRNQSIYKISKTLTGRSYLKWIIKRQNINKLLRKQIILIMSNKCDIYA